MTITHIKNPKFANPEGTQIYVEAKLNGVDVAMIADSSDPASEQVFKLAASGVYGEVEAFDTPITGMDTGRPDKGYDGSHFWDAELGLPIWWSDKAGSWIDALGNKV
jgi:hypothetical protein